MSHWAATYIGKPWAIDGVGPESFSCYGLVQEVFRVRHGIELPFVLDGAETAQTIREASQLSGWRLAEAPAQEDDLVLMRNASGRRHIGVIVAANDSLGLLHANGTLSERGPVGSVMFQRLDDLPRLGFTGLEYWRRPGNNVNIVRPLPS